MISKILIVTLGLSFFLYRVHAVDKAYIKPTDHQNIKILEAMDEAEVAMAALALKNAEDVEIKVYANQMIKDHNENSKKIVTLSNRNKIVPTENKKSKEIRQEAVMDRKLLKKLHGRNFDLSYISHQITEHQKILQTLDTLLIPAAYNSNLKDFLLKTKKAVSRHLDQAFQVQTKLAGQIAR